MKRQSKLFLTTVMLLIGLIANSAWANDYTYYDFEPDIITNYISRNAKKLGFVRVTISIQVKTPKHQELISHHAPLLRSALVDFLGKQPEQRIKSLQGREEIRVKARELINDLLLKETGQPIAEDLLFTKYLYH